MNPDGIEFIRRWGHTVSYLRAGDGRISILHACGDGAPAEALRDFEQLGEDPFGSGSAAMAAERFTTAIHPANPQFWIWGDDILQARGEFDNAPMIKFSWHPVTGEFLFIPPGCMHAAIKGKAPFADYLRGIILHDNKLVTFRPHCPHPASGDWPLASFLAQQAAQSALRQNGSHGWRYQYNITNGALIRMTGYHKW